MEIPNAPLIPGHEAVRELGRGASASVWLATAKNDGRQVAVKCFIGTATMADPQSMAGLQREVRILSRLQHEHLLRLHDVVRLGGSFDGQPGLVMDYAAGGSLGHLVSTRKRLSVGETVTVITPLARLLAFLHQEGVVHSDVSPGNVLFTAHGKPLLADLGTARMLGDPGTAPAEGTPGFNDPAVGGASGVLRPERDCFSLAALAWYCLTGMPPETASRRPPLTLLVPEVPPALAAAIEAGLQEDAAARPPAMAFGAAVYRSAAAAPVDLSDAVDSTVVPELLTRRRPAPGKGLRAKRLAGGLGRFASRLPGRASVAGAGQRPSARARRKVQGRVVGALAVALLVAGGIWWSAAPPKPGTEAPSAGAPGPAGVQVPGTTPGSAAAAGTKPGGTGHGISETVRAQLRSERPEEAIKGLSALRDTALRTGKFDLLAEVNAHRSPAAAADAKIRAQMEKAGVVLAGFTTVLKDIRVSSPPRDGEAAVTAVVETSGFEERDASGKLVRTRAAGEPQRLRLVLSKVDGGWRIADILAGST
ncbi:serine/threonine-protein kinase [Arthrobacter celericrescens]|uniref:serine/threonine-protein kinase n=1 Tax=Arthrobacter celericrescens TaxID=2320851 RepID=UPI000EA10889|nr:serine/threonine-protein kinase [Arthrobacter celericrescens]